MEEKRIPETGITYITVLDFEDMRVCQYKVDKFIHNDIIEKGVEKFITEKGHKFSSCKWMWHGSYGICRDFEPIT